MAEQWVCVFEGRSGVRARAVFTSREQARQFAERHARATTATAMPLKWEDTNDEALLTSPEGSYRILPSNAG